MIISDKNAQEISYKKKCKLLHSDNWLLQQKLLLLFLETYSDKVVAFGSFITLKDDNSTSQQFQF